MRSRFRQIGLFLSAAAVLFTSLCLPLHYHEDEAKTCPPSHCSACHFSKEGKAAPTAHGISGAPIALQETAVSLGLREPDLSIFAGHVSQRAPPSV